MTSGNRDAKKLARKLMLGEAAWGKEPMPTTVNYTQALSRANEMIAAQRDNEVAAVIGDRHFHTPGVGQVVDEEWHNTSSPEADELVARLLREDRARYSVAEMAEAYVITHADINRLARDLERADGTRYIEALGRVEQGLRNQMPEAHKELANAWESFLEHTVLDYKTLTTRGEFGPWLKVREMRLDGKPEVTAIQMYIETLSGELHLSNMWMNDEPALFNLPGDGLLRFVQKSEFGDTREVSVSVAMSTDHSVFSKRFAGMFDIISKEMDMDGKCRLSDILEVVPRPHIRDVETWQDLHKKDLVRVGMYYGESPVLGHGGGVQDARYAALDDDGINNRIYVYPEGFAFQTDYEPTLGTLGSESLVVWVPVGDGTYRHTMPVEACAPKEFAKQLIDIIMDVQEHGLVMAMQGPCGVPNCYGCKGSEPVVFVEAKPTGRGQSRVSLVLNPSLKEDDSYRRELKNVSSRIVNFIWSYHKTGRKDEFRFVGELTEKLSTVQKSLVLDGLSQSTSLALSAVSKLEKLNAEKLELLVKKGILDIELPGLIVDLTSTFGQWDSIADALELLSTAGVVDAELRSTYKSLDMFCRFYEESA